MTNLALPRRVLGLAPESIRKSRFLIIGYGNEHRKDDAVGPLVAKTIADWQLPSIKSLATLHLTENLVHDIAATDYAIFVSACSDSSRAQTVQIDPIEQGSRMFEALAVKDIHTCNPRTLLDLAQQRYGREPQAWFLQVPVESIAEGDGLSSTTQRGGDRAVRIIEQFLKTYQQPAWMNAENLSIKA